MEVIKIYLVDQAFQRTVTTQNKKQLQALQLCQGSSFPLAITKGVAP